jgi:hypothetical protein
MASMVTYLAGVGYRPGARERLGALVAGEVLRLVPEPTNPHDRNAVAVYDGDLHLGYVPKVDAPAVKKALAVGLDVTAVYSGKTMLAEIIIKWENNSNGSRGTSGLRPVNAG